MEVGLLDIPRVYTAVAEWSACIVFLLLLRRRFDKYRSVALSVTFLIVQAAFMQLTDGVVLGLWIPCMMIAFGLMVLLIYLMSRLNILESTYFAIIAFTVAEFGASMEWQIASFIWPMNPGYGIKQVIFMLAFYAAVNAIVYRTFRPYLEQEPYMRLHNNEFYSALVMGVLAFAASNLSYISKNTPFSVQYDFEIGVIRTIVDLGGLALLYAHFVQIMGSRARQDLESVQRVLEAQYQQYKQSRESIEVINYKYHDLKHQINFLRSEEDPEKRKAYLDKMEEEIRQYELQNKTGNTVVDTMLTSKSLYCDKHGITLTSVVDGEAVAFMDTMDICSIFGNALDNAIEYSLKLKDKEKRLIHVTVATQHNFVMIRFENYFEGKLKYEKGKIVSTKKEHNFHGYGIKSIRYIANKYNGVVTIDTKDGWFDLKILIPIQEENE